MNETTENEIEILEGNLTTFKEIIEKFNRKAVKFNLPQLSWKIVSSRMGILSGQESVFNFMKTKIKYVTIHIFGDVPVIKDYELIGTIDHSSKNGNIIKNISKKPVPEYFRTAPIQCDHCHTNRRRKDTYIIKDLKTNKYLQIGKNCLKDFFGTTNILQYTSWLDSLIKLNSTIGDLYQYHEGSSFNIDYVKTEHYLAFVIATVKVVTEGKFISKNEAYLSENISTAEMAKKFMLHTSSFMSKAEQEDWKTVSSLVDTEKVKNQAKEIIAKVRDDLERLKKEDKTLSDYQSNMLTLISNEYFSLKNIGFMASAYSYYDRLVAREVEEKNKKSFTNEFAGQVKDKIDEILTLIRKNSFESEWGYVTFYTFVDDKGRILVWKTGCRSELEDENKKYHIKGTIKELKIYKNMKQTILTRCKVLPK